MIPAEMTLLQGGFATIGDADVRLGTCGVPREVYGQRPASLG